MSVITVQLVNIFVACAFGAVDPKGYGIQYQTNGSRLQFGIESKVSCSETSSVKFRDTLSQVLKDMRELVEKSSDASQYDISNQGNLKL